MGEETIYRDETTGERIMPGEGYIWTKNGVTWHINHRDTVDLTDAYCIAVPRHWSDLLSAHWWYSQQRTENAVTR